MGTRTLKTSVVDIDWSQILSIWSLKLKKLKGRDCG